MKYYNELYHYGVPGMKWGVRKAKQFAEKEVSRWRNTNSKKHSNNVRLLGGYAVRSVGRNVVTGLLLGTATTATLSVAALTSKKSSEEIAMKVAKGTAIAAGILASINKTKFLVDTYNTVGRTSVYNYDKIKSKRSNRG